LCSRHVGRDDDFLHHLVDLHQPCHPNFDYPASVSIPVWGISPYALCFLCQTPPLVFKAGLSTAAARLWEVQSVSRAI
jgi:hypothetical protein